MKFKLFETFILKVGKTENKKRKETYVNIPIIEKFV